MSREIGMIIDLAVLMAGFRTHGLFALYHAGHAWSGMTPLETVGLIFKVLTLVGIVSIVAGTLRSFFEDEDSLLYVALGFTGLSGAFWIAVSVLQQ
jgi:hypothetical protein